MPFNRTEAANLLVACHRRCCICHRFCGVKMEFDHMTPQAEGGSDSIDNAIPVCFECHAEIHLYNPKHPRGRKFSSEELKGHKEQWLAICRQHPSELLEASRSRDVGPLQALLDELEFNWHVSSADGPGCAFSDSQFKRAISEGTLLLLVDDIRIAVIKAYELMGRHKSFIDRTPVELRTSPEETFRFAGSSAKKCGLLIDQARFKLLHFLSREPALCETPREVGASETA